MWGEGGVYIFLDFFEGGNNARVDKKKQTYIFLKNIIYFLYIHIFSRGGQKNKYFLYSNIFFIFFLGRGQKNMSIQIYIICLYFFLWGGWEK